MEIEAKFRVTVADLQIVARLRELGAYALTLAPAPEQQLNVYYDTPDARLQAARHGLRVRRIGTQTRVTLKGPAEVGPDSVYRRAEYEFPGEDPHPATWPSGVARDLALALTGGAPLRPIVTITTERHLLYASCAGVIVAEICLDQGTLRAGDHERPFTELEIELRPAGSRADLTALAASLGTQITLTPEPLSKLQQALTLLRDRA